MQALLHRPLQLEQPPRAASASSSGVSSKLRRHAAWTMTQPTSSSGVSSTAISICVIYAPSPAKPMKVSDRMPAMISALAVPSATSGSFASSSFSRMPAMSTSASVKPTPAPSA